MKAAFFEDADRYDLPELLANFDRPLLVVHGSDDEIIPVAEAEKAFDLNPGRVELAVLPGVDHMFLAADHRIRAASRITEWFGRQAGSGGEK